jgi:hypothetical protein
VEFLALCGITVAGAFMALAYVNYEDKHLKGKQAGMTGIVKRQALGLSHPFKAWVDVRGMFTATVSNCAFPSSWHG